MAEALNTTRTFAIRDPDCDDMWWRRGHGKPGRWHKGVKQATFYSSAGKAKEAAMRAEGLEGAMLEIVEILIRPYSVVFRIDQVPTCT